MYASVSPPSPSTGASTAVNARAGGHTNQRHSHSLSTDYANALLSSQHVHSSFGGQAGFDPSIVSPLFQRRDSHGGGGGKDRSHEVNPLSPCSFFPPSIMNNGAGGAGLSPSIYGQGTSGTSSVSPDFGLHGAGGSLATGHSLQASESPHRRRRGSQQQHQQKEKHQQGRRHRNSSGGGRVSRHAQRSVGRSAMVTFTSPALQSIPVTQVPDRRNGDSVNGGGGESVKGTPNDRSLFAAGPATAPDELPMRSPLLTGLEESAADSSRRTRQRDAFTLSDLNEETAVAVQRGASDLPAHMMCAHCLRTLPEKPSVQGEQPTADTVATVSRFRHCAELFACPCETVWYCGSVCQLAHWKVHRPSCDRGAHVNTSTAAAVGLSSSVSGVSRTLGDAAECLDDLTGVVRACFWCGRRPSSGLMGCPCGAAFYCDSQCQREDWAARHLFHCRLVSRRAVIERVLGLDDLQSGGTGFQRVGQDAATQTIPEVICAPGVDLYISPPPGADTSAGDDAVQQQPQQQVYGDGGGQFYPVTAGHTSIGEHQLASANETSTGDLSPWDGMSEHPVPPSAMRCGSAGHPHARRPSLSLMEAEGGGGSRPSASLYGYSASTRNNALHPTTSGHNMNGNADYDMSVSATSPFLAPGLSRYTTFPTETYRDPVSSSQLGRPQGRLHHRSDVNSFSVTTTITTTPGAHRGHASPSRFASRYSQSARSLRESGYSFVFSPISRQSSLRNNQDRRGSEGNGHSGEESDGHHRVGHPLRSHDTARASSPTSTYLTQQQLPGFTAFYFATRKAQLEEEAQKRAELHRQFILKKVDIGMCELRKKETDTRMAIVTDEVMACMKTLHPMVKTWKEKLFNYYYK